MPVSEVTNEDCMEMMKRYPDKFFDLAIVDPPYGIGFDGENLTMTKGLRKDGSIRDMKSWRANHYKQKYERKQWDGKPSDEYFFELARVCDRLIVWGGNYFTNVLPESGGWIVWDKRRPQGFSLSMAELAWCSFGGRCVIFRYLWHGFSQENMAQKQERIHPTQKPIDLYEFCLQNAKPGDKILDTHLGSGSSRIAAYKLGFDFWGCELDKDYFEAQEKRFKEAINEPLFQTQPTATQSKLL